MSFVDLHGHTTYSFLDGYGTPEQLAKRLKILGRTACAITDHGNVFGHVKYQKIMKANDIKPIFGCEFYIVDNIENRTRHIASLGTDGTPHVTVLALTQIGYENLMQLSTISWRDGFYHRPRIDWKLLAQYQEGLCVLSGCVGGFPSRLILEKDAGAAHKFIIDRQNQIQYYYIELVPEPGLGISMQTMPVLMDIAHELSIPVVVTSDAHFPGPEDHVAQDTMLCIGLGTTINNPERRIKLPDYQYYCTDQELMIRCYDTLIGNNQPFYNDMLWQGMYNTGLIADCIDVEIPSAAPIKFPGCGILSPADLLWSWIQQGLLVRLQNGKLPPDKWQEYNDRALMEFNLLKEKNFCDYILCLTDICRWAKAQDTLVMCRGSAGGCLLLWILQCSETDSILLDLDFNRFMDITRNDPPDIDIDFEIKMKEKVYAYIAAKYGDEKVCQILALGLIRARVAVQDVAAVHGIPREAYSPLSAALDSKDDDVDKQLTELKDPAALEVLKRYPVFRIIDGLVGQCRQSTIHAAGVLISSEALYKTIAITEQPGKPRVSSVDKHGAADLGFLKLDLLMVSAYDVLADSVRRIGANMSWLYSLPYTDEAVYRLAQSGKVAGIFQLDGAAVRIGQETHLDVFEELIAASALCRPGAVDHVPTYKRNKFDVQTFEKYMSSIHPIAREIVRKTYGILIYQEQVMRMCNQMGNMPMAQVHKLRKRIASASFHGFALGSEYGDTFFAGCEANGVRREEAEYWWEAIRAHGIYSFNRAHSATYAIVGYWMLYMKAHYPEAYYESYLKYEGASSSRNELLMKRLIGEFRSLGGEVNMVDPTCSKESFYSPRPGIIVGGWGNISGIGGALTSLIVRNAPYKNWEDTCRILPESIYYKFYECGITGHRPIDEQAIIELAPWMPIRSLGQEERNLRISTGLYSPGNLPAGDRIQGDAMICGYLTAIQKKARTGTFRGEQIIYILEDEYGAIQWRCSSKQTKLAAAVKIGVKKGDFIALCGWWTGEVLFIKDFKVLKRRL